MTGTRTDESIDEVILENPHLNRRRSPVEFTSDALDRTSLRALLADAVQHIEIPDAISGDNSRHDLINTAVSVALNKLDEEAPLASVELAVAVAARKRADRPNPVGINPAAIRAIAIVGLLLYCLGYVGDYSNSRLAPNELAVLLSVATSVLALALALFSCAMRWPLVRQFARNSEPSAITLLSSILSVIAIEVLIYAISVLTESKSDPNAVAFLALAIWPIVGVILAHQRIEEWVSEKVFRTTSLPQVWIPFAGAFIAPVALWIADFFDRSHTYEVAYPINYLPQGSGTLLIIGASALIIAVSIRQNRTYLEHLSALARDDAYTRMLATGLLPALRESFDLAVPNDKREFSMSPASAIGLSEAFDPELQVPTGSLDRIGALMRQTKGGAIGLAGPRGIGKSAVLWRLCSAPESGQPSLRPRRRLGVLLPAPTRYNAREFLFQLYSMTCQAALEGGAQPPRRRPIPPLALFQSAARWGVVGVSGVALVVVGVNVTTAGQPVPWGALGVAAIISAGVLLALASLSGFLSQVLRERSAGQTLRDQRWGLFEDWSEGRSIEDIAEGMLARLNTEQRATATASSGMKPFFLEVGTATSLEQSSREMSLPQLVGSYRDFLKRVALEREVVVGIDELDKLETDDGAIEFLNEIKGVFGVTGVYFIISVSEDALNSFDRRGLPMRNAFDSAFDDVVRLHALTNEESALLISRRAVGVPVPFKELLHALSGGIPRELIRNCRSLVQLSGTDGNSASSRDTVTVITLRDAAVQLTFADLTRKLGATPGVLKNRELPGRESLASTCIRMRDECLKGLANDAPVEMLVRLQSELTQLSIPVGEPSAVRSELVVFLYYCRTVLDVFGGVSRADDFLRSSSGELAVARAEMSESLVAAWRRLSGLRLEGGLVVEDLPVWMAGLVDGDSKPLKTHR